MRRRDGYGVARVRTVGGLPFVAPGGEKEASAAKGEGQELDGMKGDKKYTVAEIAAKMRRKYVDSKLHDGDKIDVTVAYHEMLAWADMIEVSHEREMLRLCDTLTLLCDMIDDTGFKPWVEDDPLAIAYWAARKAASRRKELAEHCADDNWPSGNIADGETEN